MRNAECGMRNARVALRAAIASCLVFISVIPSFGATYTKALADGVTLVQDVNGSPAAPIVVNVLRVNPKKPGVKIAAALGADTIIEDNATKGRETVSAMVARKGALAGINADYFPWTGDPLGPAIIGGELVSEPCGRSAIGITTSGQVVIDRLTFYGKCTAASGLTYPINGLNRQRGKNEMVLHTPVFGETTGTMDGIELPLRLNGPVRPNADVIATVTADPCAAAGSTIPSGGAILSAHGGSADWLTRNIRKGDKIKLRFDVRADSGRSWDKVTDAVGGGPWLVRNGEVYVDGADQKFKPDITRGRNPRTAAGVTTSGEMLLVTVDGRQSISSGVSLDEMAALMKKLGAVDAMNLDGGGSTTLSVRGLVINSPSGGKERPVADALLVYAPTNSTATPVIKFVLTDALVVPSGEGRPITVIDESTCQPVADDAMAAVVWGTTGGIGFVNQKGYFVPIKAGRGAVIALAGDRRVELPVTVVPGQPTKLTAKVVADPSGAPNIGQVEVSLIDANGNGIEGAVVNIAVKSGIVDAPSRTTDSKGSASFLVTWDSTAEAATVTVSAAGMTAKVSGKQ